MTWFVYPSLTDPVVAGPERVSEDKWHQPFSEPVRQKIAPTLAVALIASGLVYVNAGPFTEPVTEDRWHQGWSEPVREKVNRQLHVALATSGAVVPPISPFAETVTEDRWHQAWSEPARVRPLVLVPAQEQQFQPFDEDIIFVDRWFAWWSEPVRVKPRLPEGEQRFFAPDAKPFVTFGWYAALSEPVRTRWFPPAEQQALAFPVQVYGAAQSGWSGPPPSLTRVQYQALAWQPAPDPFVATGWFNWWSEPIRIRPALSAIEQHVFEFEPTPIIKIDWYAGFSEPVRTRPALPAAEQQFAPFDEDLSATYQWFNWWSEPVRVKAALPVGEQHVFEFEPFTFTKIDWYAWLTEPVRLKPGLAADKQKAFIDWSDQSFPNPVIPPGGGGHRRPGLRSVTEARAPVIDERPPPRAPVRWRERRAEEPPPPPPPVHVPLPPDDWIAPTQPPGVLGPITSQVAIPDTSHIPGQIAEAQDIQDIMAMLDLMPDPEAEAAEQWLAQNFGGDDEPDQPA
jgi:hypothetical protein